MRINEMGLRIWARL